MKKRPIFAWLLGVSAMFLLVAVSRADTIEVTVCGTSTAPGASGAACTAAAGDSTNPLGPGYASIDSFSISGVTGNANGQTAPFAADGTLVGFDYNFNNTGNSAATVYVWVSANNYTTGNGSFDVQATLNSIVGGGSVLLSAFESNGTTFFATDNALGGPLQLNGNLTTNSETGTVGALSTPYTLTEEFAVTLNAGADAQVTAQISADSTPAPEPASVLLLGSGLITLGLRRKVFFGL